MAYIHIFQNGVQISEGDGANPITPPAPLNASSAEISPAIPLVVKTETGFETYGDVTLGFTGGANANKWSICATEAGTYGPTLTISTPITATGTTFYVKCSSSVDEVPASDVSVDLTVSAVVAVV